VWLDGIDGQADTVAQQEHGHLHPRLLARGEVKASATVKASDFAGRALAEACGDRFASGVVLYDSTDVVPSGDRLAAAPLSSPWGEAGSRAPA